MTRFWRIFWRVVLVVSLLANAVTLGVVLRLSGLRDLANGGSSGFSGLPAPARAAFRKELADNRARLKSMLSDLGQARAAVFAAAAARPYDRAAVEAAQAKVRDLSTALQIEGQKLLLDAFDTAAR